MSYLYFVFVFMSCFIPNNGRLLSLSSMCLFLMRFCLLNIIILNNNMARLPPSLHEGGLVMSSQITHIRPLANVEGIPTSCSIDDPF